MKTKVKLKKLEKYEKVKELLCIEFEK